MRLAAIDIGTNSLHMIVVRVRPDLSFEIVDREKEMVRLGAGGLDGRALTPEAMHSALQVLSKFKRLAESHRVDTIRAVATSAVREAENGGEFLRSVTRQTGIRPRVISGTEEARLIHMAAAYGISQPGEIAVAVDIGGGSVEITRGVGGTIDVGRSFKLGVIRLTERFVKSDPIAGRDERKLVRHIDAELGDYLESLTQAGFDRVIGTSGTILSLGTVALTESGTPVGTLRARRVTAKAIHRVRKTVTSLDIEKRLRVPGLDPRRADLSVAGAVLLDTILQRLNATHLTLCDMSLREGLVLDTSPGIARRSPRSSATPTFGAAASSSWPSAATTGRNMRGRSRVWRRRCLIRPAASTASPTASANGSNTPRCCTISVSTSATSSITSTPIT
jgi:exopolyphosphatase / guanosine-5'-triphosphate,3'-diphosphate pyrophosphatase